MRNHWKDVGHYISQLSTSGDEDAWHSLVEVGVPALPHILEAFDAMSDSEVRIALVQVVCEYRSADAIPFFERLLQDENSEVWKAALDGLVTLGGEVVLDVLAQACEHVPAQKREWIDEAVEQINDGLQR